jgi:transcriptional regulator with XRE-family HTH domain
MAHFVAKVGTMTHTLTPDEHARRLKDVSANLRFMCERRGPISEICRKLKINRQQFNKYLAGQHLPSHENIHLIANYFGISREIFLTGHDQFRALVEGNFFSAMEELKNARKAMKFLELVTVSSRYAPVDCVGVYDRYQYSSIYSRKILKSSFCIFRNGDFLCHYYIERFPSYDRPQATDYIFKYHGLVFPLDGRLFTIDYESVQKNEMTFGVYSSVQRNSKRFMFGLASGIAATMFRHPYATRVVLHYRRPGLLSKK